MLPECKFLLLKSLFTLKLALAAPLPTLIVPSPKREPIIREYSTGSIGKLFVYAHFFCQYLFS